MKNAVSWVLVLILTITLLNNCLQTKSYKEIRAKQSFVDQLRAAYSSGDQKKWPKPILDPSKPLFSEIGHLPKVEFPSDNPYSEDKVLLGRTLFYDPRLSNSNQIACASCHDPELGWTDNRKFSFGHDRQLGSRNAMTIMNVAFAKSLFWDGRAVTLEDQAKMPIEDMREMHEHIDIATDKIVKVKGYEILFEKAFGNKKITKDKIAKAIATFERTVVSPATKFDRFIDGEKDAFTNDELMGLHLFRTKAQCMNCHNSGYFSNNLFENDGTSLLGSDEEDLGQYLITKRPADAGKFRVPTLREVTKTGPWMHDGSFNTLTEVIQFYSKGNPESSKHRSTIHEGVTLHSEKSDMLKLLELTTEEIHQIEAFLGTLSTPVMRPKPPVLPK
ncbi:Cytochrome c551 peroxidase [Chryseobacterium aquaeductus]|uniref:Methylamine utilization protein MauG n=1 Tax=Chryseobacterium aquaeductus TaxID=2675056 RepID=A0A9N8MQV9_9FLAO|nr:cytochrome c peroxidase [Chryseobacterium aquaeductus]CAA7332377.1 Cytochrome c551 peroxidase [Chryseobacterium potabilaquae]CAD7816094.1 Cytochrome c551 peroxidase [Chryseobacterium aquaeductus]